MLPNIKHDINRTTTGKYKFVTGGGREYDSASATVDTDEHKYTS